MFKLYKFNDISGDNYFRSLKRLEKHYSYVYKYLIFEVYNKLLKGEIKGILIDNNYKIELDKDIYLIYSIDNNIISLIDIEFNNKE